MATAYFETYNRITLEIASKFLNFYWHLDVIVNMSASTHTNSRILCKYSNISVILERSQIPSVPHRSTLPAIRAMPRHIR